MDVKLNATSGRATGSAHSRRLRASGSVPGVLYGLGQEPLPLTVDWADLRRALTTEAGLNALITLEVDGSTNLTLVKDIQRHAVRRDVMHVDFIAVDPDATITVEVPVVLIGDADEVANEGGIVDQLLYMLTVDAKPDSIPNELEVDVSGLTLTETIKVSDIVLPAGVTTEVDPEEAVAVGQIVRATLAEEAAPTDISDEDGEAVGGEGDTADGAAGGEN